MNKGKFVRGNIHKSDHLRAVVTDTLPGEVPIVFSNDGFYKNQKRLKSRNPDSKVLLENILDKKVRFTIPYRYRVSKDALNTRRLSLIHPSAQLSIARFYGQYEELICSSTSISEFSIRCPSRVGSTYFFRSTVSEKNKYKGQGIDTLQFDKRVRNPASYFAYSGFDRLYKFFESERFIRLEKKYRTMWFGDVSKCFDSIYTHSIAWAVKDMPFSKASIGKQFFGSEFDRLMQSVNYNETNGICIGPEVSRIFAEIILQQIDQTVLIEAVELGLKYRQDYECVRYVDDLMIFSKDSRIAAQMYSLYESALLRFNLHLNQLKLLKYERPFQTSKSLIIQKLGISLNKLQDQMIDAVYANGLKHSVPKHIYRPSSMRRSFIKDIKAICIEVGVGYDMASNYLISSLSNRLEALVDGYPHVDSESRPDLEKYLTANMVLLDIMFFFYTTHPTVSTSFKLAKAIVLAIQFTRLNAPTRKEFLSERLAFWTLELVRSIERAPDSLKTEKVPIEVINIVLALGEADSGRYLSTEFLSRTIFEEGSVEYFAITSLLFFIRDKSEYLTLKDTVEKLLLEKFSQKIDLGISSHDAHLFLDVVACPYLSPDLRAEIVRLVLKSLDLKPMRRGRRLAMVGDIGQHSWFINWSGIDLLNMIKRKELSQVY